MLTVDRKSVELVNCTLVGNHELLQTAELKLEDCFIIPKDNIANINHMFQGRMVIETKPDYEV